MMNEIYHQGPPSSSRTNESDSILVPSGRVLILNRSKVDLKRNDLRLYKSLLRHGCRKAFLHTIWEMRYMNLLQHSYKMEISRDISSNPSKRDCIKATKIKWSR